MKLIYQNIKKTLFKRLLITLMICFSMSEFNIFFAQNTAWILAPKYKTVGGVTSLPVAPPNDGYDGSPAVHTQNMQLDAQGNVLFFVVDGVVYDKAGYQLGELKGEGPSNIYKLRGNAEVVIVPDPNNCSRYYIFASGKASSSGISNKFPYYAIVDMSTNSLVQDANGNTAFFMLDFIPNGITVFQSNSPRVSGITYAASKLITSNISRAGSSSVTFYRTNITKPCSSTEQSIISQLVVVSSNLKINL